MLVIVHPVISSSCIQVVVLRNERTFGVAYGETLSSDFGVVIFSAASPVGARAERQQLWILPDFSYVGHGVLLCGREYCQCN